MKKYLSPTIVSSANIHELCVEKGIELTDVEPKKGEIEKWLRELFESKEFIQRGFWFKSKLTIYLNYPIHLDLENIEHPKEKSIEIVQIRLNKVEDLVGALRIEYDVDIHDLGGLYPAIELMRKEVLNHTIQHIPIIRNKNLCHLVHIDDKWNIKINIEEEYLNRDSYVIVFQSLIIAGLYGEVSGSKPNKVSQHISDMFGFDANSTAKKLTTHSHNQSLNLKSYLKAHKILSDALQSINDSGMIPIA